MENRKIIKIGLLVLGTVFAQACTSEFEEINTNPNNPVTVSPAVLLPNAIQVSVDRYWGHSTRYQRVSIDGGSCWVQHLGRIIYPTEGDNYEAPLDMSTETWKSAYSSSLINFERIMKLSEPGETYQNTNYEGVALTMKAFTFSYLTDIFGPIPYSEALKGTAEEGISSPEYDDVETIYAGLLNDLAAANEKLIIGGPAISGDIMFGGDISRWKKFTNSLRLKLANRQAAKKPEASRAIMQQILSDPATYPLFSSNEDYALLKHSTILESSNTWFRTMVNQGRTDWRLSKTIVDKLLALDDERLKVYGEPIQVDGVNYEGVPNGLPDVLTAENGSFYSTLNPKFYQNTAPSILMSYSELLFILAEAAVDGDIAIGNAETYLEDAIKASFQQHGLTMPDDYLTRIGTVNKETILTQKWIALFGQGIEAWTEYRRTGFPNLPAPDPRADFRNNGIVPTRLIYPSSEYSLNKKALDIGLSKLGGVDDMKTQLWWAE